MGVPGEEVLYLRLLGKQGREMVGVPGTSVAPDRWSRVQRGQAGLRQCGPLRCMQGPEGPPGQLWVCGQQNGKVSE